MAKINLKAILLSSDDDLIIETSGIKNNNKIIYKENDIKVTILMFNNKIHMNRVCNDYDIDLIFEKNKKTISKYKVFNGTKVFDLKTITKKLDICNKKIELEYELEGNTFKYLLKWEVSNEDNIKE